MGRVISGGKLWCKNNRPLGKPKHTEHSATLYIRYAKMWVVTEAGMTNE